MKNETEFEAYVRKINSLPTEEKQRVVDAMSIEQAVRVFNVALNLAMQDLKGS
jgi:hypothetical protein